jgi:hypothetical protein
MFQGFALPSSIIIAFCDDFSFASIRVIRGSLILFWQMRRGGFRRAYSACVIAAPGSN